MKPTDSYPWTHYAIPKGAYVEPGVFDPITGNIQLEEI